MNERRPFAQLLSVRVREFWREPEVVFWVFGFPVLLAIGLGIAFRNRPPEVIAVGVVRAAGSEELLRALSSKPEFEVEVLDVGQAEQHLRLGKISLVVVPGDPQEYRFDPTRPESVLARLAVDDALQSAAGRLDPVPVREALITKPGARYIDFLIPGLLGMNIMSGGMWGVGYVIVDMRTRKLLKRLIATPMKKRHFLAAMMASRMALVFAEMIVLLLVGRFLFDLTVQGPLVLVALIALVGSFVFAALGLFVASRARKVETVSGLINLVMLPMFVFSGIFFSSERFPDLIQPFVKALPLTILNDALRAVILEGASLTSQALPIICLLAWGLVAFFLALRMFRWT